MKVAKFRQDAINQVRDDWKLDNGDFPTTTAYRLCVACQELTINFDGATLKVIKLGDSCAKMTVMLARRP